MHKIIWIESKIIKILGQLKALNMLLINLVMLATC